jgi:hypothetical protein
MVDHSHPFTASPWLFYRVQFIILTLCTGFLFFLKIDIEIGGSSTAVVCVWLWLPTENVVGGMVTASGMITASFGLHLGRSYITELVIIDFFQTSQVF